MRMADPPAREELDAQYASERATAEMAYQEHGRNQARYDKILHRIERYIAPGDFLDIGCSIGSSLVTARVRGWSPVGLELSQPAAEYAREELGLDVRQTSLEESDLDDASFDGVLMNHTLEHLREPAYAFSEVHRLLRPGGIMYQALPNADSLKAKLLGSCWGYGIHAAHLSYFGPRTLTLLARRLGFDVLQVWSQSYREDPRLIYDVMRRLGKEAVLEKWCGGSGQGFDRERYVRFITDRPLARWISQRLWPARMVSALGLGEELHLIARKV